MKPHRPHAGHAPRLVQRAFMAAWLVPLMLLACDSGLAAPVDLGRLFYTPEQRAQLEAARIRSGVAPAAHGTVGAPDRASAAVRFDGLVIRSDGKTTSWVDGKPQPGPSAVPGLKPGQIRVDGKVYEPYQVLRPVAPDASPGEPAEESPPR